VVHGVPAIAVGIRRGVTSVAQRHEEDLLHIEPWGRTFRPDADGEEPLARAALGTLALEWERFFHGAPSGIDNVTSAMGGLLCFQQASPVRRIPPARSFALVVAHSGQRSSTRDMVARVAQQLAERPSSVRRMLEEVHALVITAEDALLNGELGALGRVLDRNHAILRSLRLSTPQLEELCGAARAAGALGAKITGAGGGGCIVALAENSEHAVRIADALRTKSFIEEVSRAA
jgi:mevalonate kinase